MAEMAPAKNGIAFDDGSVLQNLDAAIDVGLKLANSLGSVKQALREIRSEQEEIERVAKTNANLDPETAEEIRKLRRKIRFCIRCAHDFLKQCLLAARYGLDDNLKQEINEELKNKKLDTLKSFLKILVEYFEKCEKDLKEFNDAQVEANAIEKEMRKRYKERLTRRNIDTEQARRQHESAILKRSFYFGVRMASGIGLVGGCTMIYLQPQQTYFWHVVSGVMAAVLIGSFAFEHVAAADHVKSKDDLASGMRDQFKFKRALNSIEELKKSMDEVMNIIEDMARHVERGFTQVDGEEGLKRNTSRRLDPAQYRNIQIKLDSLCASMRAIQQELGEDGENFRGNADELISNTTPVQSTSNGDFQPYTVYTPHTHQCLEGSETTEAIQLQVHDDEASAMAYFTGNSLMNPGQPSQDSEQEQSKQ